MPYRHHETPTLGDWVAEYFTTRTIRRQFRTPAWRRYNRPHHHIHGADTGYAFEYLAPNLKAANLNQGSREAPKRYPLRMRNVKTGDVILADVL